MKTKNAEELQKVTIEMDVDKDSAFTFVINKFSEEYNGYIPLREFASVLAKWINEYASFREKETAIKFAIHCSGDGENIDDRYDSWYTKHKSSATRRPAK